MQTPKKPKVQTVQPVTVRNQPKVGQALTPSNFEKRQAKKVARAKTRATVAEIEGEGTVAQKRDNRASRVSTMAGTRRAKTPKSVSTSTSTVNNNSNGNKRSGTGMTGSGPTKPSKGPAPVKAGPVPSARGPIPKAKMGMSVRRKKSC